MATPKTKTEKKAKKTPKAKAAPAEPIKFKDHTIKQKRSGRYEVLGKDGKNVKGEDKVKVLVDAKLLKIPEKKAPKAEAETAAT